MRYKGYIIKEGAYGFYVTTPLGQRWPERAVTIETAKRWIDLDILEHHSVAA